jgi:hypothetical protein
VSEKLMSKIVTGSDLSEEVMAVLHRWGIPKHAISLNLKIEARKAVEINCTFHPEAPDGSLEIDGDALKVVTQRFRLIPVEDVQDADPA